MILWVELGWKLKCPSFFWPKKTAQSPSFFWTEGVVFCASSTDVTAMNSKMTIPPAKDMVDLFGSDMDSDEDEDEVEFRTSGVITEMKTTLSSSSNPTPTRPGNPTSTPTEEDVLWLPHAPAIVPGSQVSVVTLPNILRFRPKETTSHSLAAEMMMIMDEEEDHHMYQHACRWRRTDDGKKETNAKMVEWDDGSFTYHLGTEVFVVSRHAVSNGFVFVNQTSIGPEDDSAEGREDRLLNLSSSSFVVGVVVDRGNLL